MTAGKCFFFFLSGAKKGKIEESDAQVVRIGRQPYCEIPLDPFQDIPASGEHCHVVREDDGSYAITDPGSSYGTYVNDVRIQGVQKLNTGDVIECGRDDQGRIGPKLKFYLEADVKKCPICDGPVYKKNFRCPSCRKKCCLRCIDFATKTCKLCAPAELERRARPVHASDVAVDPNRPASVGYEVLPDDAEVSAKKPAKVVLKGKEAERARRKKEKQKAEKGKTKVLRAPGVEPSESGTGSTTGVARSSVGTSSSLSGNVSGSGSKKGGAPAAKKDTLSDPFCPICCDFVKGAAFRCPQCQRTVCDSHRQGRACATCAGSSAMKPPPAPPVTRRQAAPPPLARALQDSLMTVEEAPGFPDLPAPSDSGARRPPPQRAKGEIPTGVEVDLEDQAPGKQAAPPPRPLAPPPPLPRAGSPPLPALAQGSTMRLSRERGPVAAGPAPCLRCRLPLQDSQAFVCGGCARRVCATHRTPALLCDECTARRGTSSFGRASPLMSGAPIPRSGTGPVPPAPRPGAPAPGPLELKNDSWGGNVIDRDGPPPEVARPFGFTTLELPPDEIVSPDQHPAAGPLGLPMGPTIREIEAMDMMPLLETEREDDDDLAPRQGGALEGLQFECPFCDAPLPPDATACPRCRKKL